MLNNELLTIYQIEYLCKNLNERRIHMIIGGICIKTHNTYQIRRIATIFAFLCGFQVRSYEFHGFKGFKSGHNTIFLQLFMQGFPCDSQSSRRFALIATGRFQRVQNRCFLDLFER